MKIQSAALLMVCFDLGFSPLQCLLVMLQIYLEFCLASSGSACFHSRLRTSLEGNLRIRLLNRSLSKMAKKGDLATKKET